MPKPHVLILIDWFLPGYKAGGPIRSTINLIRALKHHYDFSIITKNHDHKDKTPYENVESNKWTEFEEGVKVYYYDPHQLTYSHLLTQVRKIDFQFLHLNTMYSLPFTIWPLMMIFRRQLSLRPILAPRGNLSPGSLAEKALKKRVYLTLFKWLGLHKNVIFHAASEHEVADIQNEFGQQMSIRYAPNMPEQVQFAWNPPSKAKLSCKMYYAARISPEKKLDFFLEQLVIVPKNAKLEFDIYGPIENPEYWQKCQDIMAHLPEGVKVRYIREFRHNELAELMAPYHFGVLTSSGENFGHSIFEGFLGGKPMLISDRTPWKNLAAQKIGWDIPLERPDLFEKTIMECLDMDNNTYQKWSEAAWKFAQEYKESPELIDKSISLFS